MTYRESVVCNNVAIPCSKDAFAFPSFVFTFQKLFKVLY